MKIHKFVPLILTLTCLVWSEVSKGQDISLSSVDLVKLVQEADTIVIGQVVNIDELEEAQQTLKTGQIVEGNRHHATLQIDRVIKTTPDMKLSKQLEFDYVRSTLYRRLNRIEVGGVGVYFLRVTPSKTFTPVDPFCVSLPALQKLPPEVNKEKLAQLDSFGKVLSETLMVLEFGNDKELQMKILYLFPRIEDPSIDLVLHRILKHSDTPLHQHLIAVLIERNELSVLKEATTFLANPEIEESEELRDAAMRVAHAIQGKVKNPEAIPLLVPLLDSPNAVTREAAYFALREMGSEQCTEYLLRALHDSETRIRFNGAFGLAMLTNQTKWALTVDMWEADEKKYINHWLEWEQKVYRRNKK